MYAGTASTANGALGNRPKYSGSFGFIRSRSARYTPSSASRLAGWRLGSFAIEARSSVIDLNPSLCAMDSISRSSRFTSSRPIWCICSGVNSVVVCRFTWKR